MTIEMAVKACRETQYKGWQMVTFVQKYVNKHMKYSKHNASSLRPDTLHMDPATYIVDVKTRTAYILDAKYYRYVRKQ